MEFSLEKPKMDIRAIEDIGVGKDLTPPLRPLAAVLHDASLSSHCSACFSTLPPQPFPPSIPTFPQNPRHVPTHTPTPTPLYCSIACFTADSALHFSSAERQFLSLFAASSSGHDSSDHRLSLRLAHILQNLPQSSVIGIQETGKIGSPDGCLERIAGLMTNRENLVFSEIKKSFGNREDYDEDFENFMRIREGAKMMAKARGKDVNLEGFAFEEMLFCLVITNSVEVQERNGFCIGIAVYDTAFSWFNHSCSPNSCYRFLVGPGNDEQMPLRISPATEGVSERGNGYGPRVVVRSVKAIGREEEVTISYTDILQPKELRQVGLWFKYRFKCSCKRCAGPGYVDFALQAHSIDNLENPEYSDDKIEKQMQNSAISDAITAYLSSGDSESCCQKLEFLLCNGDFNENSLEPKEAKSHRRAKIHPFHYLSINAYIALASAYKVQAGSLPGLCYDHKGQIFEALNMYKTSSAYSLLLAGVVNHLYTVEPAFVTTASNFWINAGESLLNLARCSLWDDSFKLELSSLQTLKCDGCCLVNGLEGNTLRRDQKMQLEEIKSRLCNCIAIIAAKVWSFLSSQSDMLKYVENPVDFNWLKSPAALEVSATGSQLSVEICSDQVRTNLMLLSIHCLRYGALLSSICYGLSVETNYRRALDVIMQT